MLAFAKYLLIDIYYRHLLKTFFILIDVCLGNEIINFKNVNKLSDWKYDMNLNHYLWPRVCEFKFTDGDDILEEAL